MGKLASAKDEGECIFGADLATGKVTVTVRAPLSIDKRSVEIPIMELMEITAQITLASIAAGREVQQHLLNKVADGPKPA